MTTDFPSSFEDHSMIKMVGYDMAKSGWHLAPPRFVGVIVTDQELGVGQLINGIPVVDHLIITKYLRKASLNTV